jgi:hypothetical protein
VCHCAWLGSGFLKDTGHETCPGLVCESDLLTMEWHLICCANAECLLSHCLWIDKQWLSLGLAGAHSLIVHNPQLGLEGDQSLFLGCAVPTELWSLRSLRGPRLSSMVLQMPGQPHSRTRHGSDASPALLCYLHQGLFPFYCLGYPRISEERSSRDTASSLLPCPVSDSGPSRTIWNCHKEQWFKFPVTVPCLNAERQRSQEGDRRYYSVTGAVQKGKQ